MADPEEPSPTPVDEEEASPTGVEEGEDPTGVEVVPAPQTVPLVTLPKDHFTLSHPTTTIRYRMSTNAARIIEDADKQYILEEADDKDGKHEITIRQLHDTSEGVRFLRATYTLAVAFWTGFLFVFAVQILLFVFLDLAIQFGITSGDDIQWGAGLGVMFSIMPFVHSLAAALVIAGVYVMDTSRGHPLTRSFTLSRLRSTTIDWVYFFFFVGLPTSALIVTLLSGTDDFWAITGLIWIISILVFFSIFAFNVVLYEIKACFEVIKNMYNDDDDSFLNVIQRAIMLRQVSTYGGYKTVTVVSMGAIKSSEDTENIVESVEIPGTRQETLSYRAKLTAWQGFLSANMYEILPEPKKIYTTDDARDIRPFITRYTWSLDKVFCRPSQSRYIAIIAGPGSITRSQMRSSVACSVLGTAAILMLVLSLLVYMEAGTAATLFVLAIGVLLVYPSLKSSFRLWKVSKQLLELRDDVKTGEKSRRDLTFSERQTEIGEKESEGIYITSIRYRITKPTRWFALTMFGMELFFLFFWPLVSYFAIGNWPVGLLYFVIVGVSGMRYYLNAALVLEETGRMDFLDAKTELEQWKAQSRLDEIVGSVSRARSKKVFNVILGFFGLIYLALFAGAIGSGQEDTSQGFDLPFTYVSKDLFQYQQTDSLRYPSCTVTSDLGDSPLLTMADYAYLAGHAYRGTETSQEELDLYFDGLNVTDRQDLVREIRERTIDSKVSFKLVTAPGLKGDGDIAYLVIRGTVTPWDAMTDAQLWSPAALMQFLRIVLPFGHIWTPVMPYLISAITKMESEAIDEVSFYKDTVAFTNYIKERFDFVGTAITGHSLGGGLSIITGAITHTPAIALSGPNAVLTRRSLEPKVTTEELDRYTFNIVPERDIVPMFDDKAQNYQMIRCLADFQDVVGCHTALRSFCEIAYSCGSLGRPVLCECVTDFGYPEPEPVNGTTISFSDACAAAKEEREASSNNSDGDEL